MTGAAGLGTCALLLLGSVLLHFAAEPWRWLLYLGPGGRVTYRQLFAIFAAASFGSYILPAKLGIPLRVYLLRRVLLLSLGELTALLSLDAVIYYGGWTVAASVGALLFPVSVEVSAASLVWVAAGGLSVVALGIWFYQGRVFGRTHSGSTRPRIARVAAEGLAALRQAGVKAVLPSVAVTGVDVLGQSIRHWTLFYLVGHPLSFEQAFAITSASIFSGLASLLPMGLGGYDVVLVLLLGASGVPVELALLVPVMNRTITVAISAALGVWGGAELAVSPWGFAKAMRSE